MRALPSGAQEGHKFRGKQDVSGGKKKVTKKLVCHHAKWRHLNISGGGGPGQRAEGGLPRVCAVARARRLGRQQGGKGTPKPPRSLGQPFSGSAVPCLLPRPRASRPRTLTPVYKHSPGAGWGGRNARWRGGGGLWLPRTPPAARSEELVRESGPGSWKGLNALFLKLSIPSTPIVRASCKTSQAF